MSRSYDIFVSHSGAQKDVVELLATELAQVCERYSVFYDRNAIEYGERISSPIVEYARTCKLAVAVLSEEYFTRSKWPMMELAASYTAAKAGNGSPSLPCLLPVFFALRPEDAKGSNTQKGWRKMWKTWEVNENMDPDKDEKRKSRPRQDVQRTVWKEAVDQLLDTRGPVYDPPEYGYEPEVFMKKVAQVIARKLDDLNGGIRILLAVVRWSLKHGTNKEEEEEEESSGDSGEEEYYSGDTGGKEDSNENSGVKEDSNEKPLKSRVDFDLEYNPWNDQEYNPGYNIWK